jgi:hypothetical protein
MQLLPTQPKPEAGTSHRASETPTARTPLQQLMLSLLMVLLLALFLQAEQTVKLVKPVKTPSQQR